MARMAEMNARIPAPAGSRTPAQLVQQADRVVGPGPSSRRTIYQLIAHHSGWSEAQVFARPDQPLDSDVSEKVRADLERLRAGCPAGYVFGYQDFLKWRFSVDARALCPRPETEALMERVTLNSRLASMPFRAVDLGCGSGVMGLSLALAFPRATVVLTDVDADALSLAAENTRSHGLSSRVRLVRSHWWEALQGERFDVVLSNPPYVGRQDFVEPGVRNFEPGIALWSEQEGTAAIREILRELDAHLSPGAWAAFELDAKHARSLDAQLRGDFPGRFHWECDPFGVTRYLFVDASRSLGGGA